MDDKSEIVLPSNEKFGITFAVIFGLVAAYFMYVGRLNVTAIFGGLSAVFLLIVYISPKLLHPLNRAWMAFGYILGRIISPITMGVIFFVLISPLAIFLRVIGRDELRLKRRANTTYWRVRDDKIVDGASLKKQF